MGKEKGDKVTLIIRKIRNLRAGITNLWKKLKSHQ
jgi:hypothetical protein